MYKILIVDDDLIISREIKKALDNWGYESKITEDFKNVLNEFIEFKADIVLLDIGLPFFNGYHWCREIRKISKVPIIFISSMNDSMNIIMAMNMEGDDFIVKPFDINVLVAKIQALIRRSYEFRGNTNILENKNVILNIEECSITYKENKLELTKNEFKIIQILFENAGKVISREDIMIKLWDSDSFIDDNTLTVNIARLRKKLQGLEINDLIKTKKGMGYMVE
ncbi:response regulator transcription factor [Clostridium thermobutyricum]|uniref:response regulator transcription factor n=1 Tax=Clostridium thermobutyricum TaxID=29372 RepID=UPI0018A93FFF|nr:response regulator transcription factor [Clostridium thermobutyricum]